MKQDKWIEIDYDYYGKMAQVAELGYEAAIIRIESLVKSGAIIMRVEEQREG